MSRRADAAHRAEAAAIAQLCCDVGHPEHAATLLREGVSLAIARRCFEVEPDAPAVEREAVSRWTSPAGDEDDDTRFVDIRLACTLAGLPGRAVEMVERGLPRREAYRILREARGELRPIETAPFPSLFVMGWSPGEPSDERGDTPH